MYELPSIDEFKAMYEEFKEACRKKDRDYFKAMLPDYIPNDQFSFLVGMWGDSIRGIEKSGIEPVVEQDGISYKMVYNGDIGNGMDMMTEDFFYVEGKWLKYDPAQE